MSVPEGAACCICLDEGPDVHGRPLVRDCSCRGDSAGFAHVSCLVQYAERKTTENAEKALEDMEGFHWPWKNCPNCEQRYRGNLSLEMSNAFLSFAKQKYDFPGNSSDDKIKVMDALRTKIESTTHILFSSHGNKSVEEMAESDIKDIIDRAERLKQTTRIASWIHQPRDSDKFRCCKLLLGNYEGMAYFCLGNIYSMRNYTKDNVNIAIKYYTRALTIAKLLDSKDEVKRAEGLISFSKQRIKAECGEGGLDFDAALLQLRDNYKYAIKNFGENSENAIRSGLGYARALGNEKHCRIEAERLTTELTARSRQIHGAEHRVTKYAESELEQCKTRRVKILSFPSGSKCYRLLRYEDGRVNCVVKGPIADPGYENGRVNPIAYPKNAKAEETLTIPSSRIFPGLGCPVTCHGLKSAPDLNGKLGEVRCISSEREVRCAVHFEDKTLKPVSIKPENLWVVIELPQK